MKKEINNTTCLFSHNVIKSFESEIIIRNINNNIPEHVFLSDPREYPVWQWHLYDPAEFLQTWLQPPLYDEHSFMSTKKLQDGIVNSHSNKCSKDVDFLHRG